MLLIAGIIPVSDFPLTFGKIQSQDHNLIISNYLIPPGQGTAAMSSAALALTDHLSLERPHAVYAGDIGSGEGSASIYEYLIDNLLTLSPRVLVLHYWLPNLDLMRKLCKAIDKCTSRPLIIADAASMYAAKAAGLASAFDLFTPDLAELAFLADPEAIHPAYINQHLFKSDESRVSEFISDAYRNKGAARYILAKGKTDVLAGENGIIAAVKGPDIPEMECIGGTGDTITGMCAAFLYKGMDIKNAAITSLRVNRLAGQLAGATPATGIKAIIEKLPDAYEQIKSKSGSDEYVLES